MENEVTTPPKKAHRVFFYIIGAIVTFVVVEVIGAIIGRILLEFDPSLDVTLPIKLTSSVVLILIYGYMIKKFQKPYAFQTKPTKRALFTGFAFSGLLAIISNAIMQLINKIAQLFPVVEDMSNDYVRSIGNFLSGSDFIILFISIVILVPIAEELLFRGIILEQLYKKVGAKWSIFITGLLFGIFHFNPIQSIYTTVIGWLLCWITLRYKSIKIPIITHMGFNLFGGFIPVILSSIPDEEQQGKILLIFLLIIVALTITCVALLYDERRNKKKTAKDFPID